MAACALVLAGCGGGAEELDRSAEPTGFEMALDDVGRGISPSGIGFGWVDIAAIRDAAGPAAVREAAAALGPGADELLERGAALRRSAGFDPLTADAAIGLGASYAFGVRFDGVNAARLGDRLDAAGARSYRIGAWTVYDLGEQAQAPTSGPLADLDTFAARVAIRNGAVIMARVDSTRYALLGVGGSTVADEALAFGAACLGEVDAARTLPGGFTHNAVASPDLIALGRRVGAPAGGEVLCAVDRSADDAEEQASDRRHQVERERGKAIEQVAVGEHQALDAIGVVRRHDLGDRAARVVADQRRTLDPERVHERHDHLRHPRWGEVGVGIHRDPMRAHRPVAHEAAEVAREALGDPGPEPAVDEQPVDEDDRLAVAEVAVGDGSLGQRDGLGLVYVAHRALLMRRRGRRLAR